MLRQTRGQACETFVAQWLQTQGYRMLARNCSFAAGELDIVALDGDTLAIVEIRSRSQPSAEAGAWLAVESISPTKQRRIIAATSAYLARSRERVGPVRFDVVGVGDGPQGYVPVLVRGAFTTTSQREAQAEAGSRVRPPKRGGGWAALASGHWTP